MPAPPNKPGAKNSAGLLQDQRARDEAERQDRHRSEELADECAEIEEDLEALKARFEMFFLNIERREPAREREEIKRRVARLMGEFTRNTGLRFRIQTLHARFISYERLWLRSAREKEAGTYRRDLVRARRKAQALAQKAERDGAAEASGSAAAPPKPIAPPLPGTSMPAPGSLAAPAPPLPSASTPAAPAPRPGGPAAPSPSVSGGMTEEKMRALFDAYVEAKKRCNEDTSRLSYQALARSITKQVPELMDKYKARSVEFKVIIRDGKTILKAVPVV